MNRPLNNKQQITLQQAKAEGLDPETVDETKVLLIELNRAGIDLASIWDLVNAEHRYPQAIGILLDHVTKEYSFKSKEGIVRALATKDAVGKATPVLINEYHKIPKNEWALRWAIGNTVCATVTKNDSESIFSVVSDKANGTSRQMFVLALAKLRFAKAEDTLIMLLDDDEVVLHAISALIRLKSKKAERKLNHLTQHVNKIVQKHAVKALTKFKLLH